MAKKSRRQNLPTEKDFERLRAPKPARPEPVEEQVPVDELDSEEDVPVAQDVERDVGTHVGDAAAAEAGEPIETKMCIRDRISSTLAILPVLSYTNIC